ncbi:TonB-dependent siderophore receptor [Paraburkholderia tropica]|uniref:TonB-dependent siderophore receptor n=1 Tax=Paraburkholderia tropica TaxID=92647 RepID=UPI002AB78EFC|nr:TonB-dependent receptor [Paraburkholderia tropica]
MHNFLRLAGPSFVRNSVATAVLLALSVPALAQGRIDLPPQSLADSLAALATQTGANIIAPGALVAGHLAPKVVGASKVTDALDHLLEGSGLRYEKKGDKTFVIEPVASTSVSQQVLPSINVTDSQQTTGGGLIATSTSTATKTDTPIAETPQTIQIVTQTQLRDQGVQSVTQALQSVSGVVVGASSAINPIVYIGGMQASTMSNGSNDLGNNNSLGLPIAAVQSVEVIKGADAILTGSMNPSGVVNVVTKQPTPDTVREVTLQTGSYGDMLSALDLGGALTDDKRLMYRFVISGERTGETSGGYNGTRNFYVAPSVEWKSADTDLLLQYSHNVSHDVPIPATMFYLNGGPIPISGRTENPSTVLLQEDQLQFTFKQQLGNYLQFVSKTSYDARKQSISNNTTIPFEYIGSPDMTYYGIEGQLENIYSYDTDNHVQAKFNIGPVRQTLIAGFDYSVYWSSNWAGSDYALVPFPSDNLPGVSTPYSHSDSGRSYFNNVYLQDQLSWKNLHVSASIARASDWTATLASQSQWLPSIGILYQLTDSLAVYANDLRSFMPEPLPTAGGGVTPPQSGHSVEAGVKLSLLQDNLSIDARAYRTALNNVPTFNYTTYYYESAGEQVTRGFDISIKGQIAPGLRVTAGYTYADPQVPLSTQSSIAPHSGNVWLYYDLQGERFHGFGGGIGVTASNRVRYTDAGGTSYTVPGQAETDATLWYKAKRWSATFVVRNLFNRTLYQTTAAANYEYLQPGRLLYLTGRYNF